MNLQWRDGRSKLRSPENGQRKPKRQKPSLQAETIFVGMLCSFRTNSDKHLKIGYEVDTASAIRRFPSPDEAATNLLNLAIAPGLSFHYRASKRNTSHSRRLL